MRGKVFRAKYYKCINKQGSPPSLAGYQPITLGGGGGYEKVKRKRGKMKSKKEKEERKRVMESIR